MQSLKHNTKARAVLLYANNAAAKAATQVVAPQKQPPRRLDEIKCVLLRGTQEK